MIVVSHLVLWRVPRPWMASRLQNCLLLETIDGEYPHRLPASHCVQDWIAGELHGRVVRVCYDAVAI